jgi:hypothetical protein
METKWLDWIRKHLFLTILIPILCSLVASELFAWKFHPLSWTWRHVGAFVTWVGRPVTVTRWHYWVLVFVSSASAGTLILLIISMMVRPAIKPNVRFKEGRFLGLTWRWEWDARGRFEPESMRPYCPICDRLLETHDVRGDYTDFNCNCGFHERFSGSYEDTANSAIREIDLHLRKGTWNRFVTEEST